MRHKWSQWGVFAGKLENLYFAKSSAHRYLEVFKGIVVLVGGVDTVENPVHPHPYNDFAVDDEVYGSRFACGQLVYDQMSYIGVIPRINRVIRNPNPLIP